MGRSLRRLAARVHRDSRRPGFAIRGEGDAVRRDAGGNQRQELLCGEIDDRYGIADSKAA